MDKETAESAYQDFVNSYIGTDALSKLNANEPKVLECVIVEPRAHDALKGVLHNTAHFFPNASFTIYHSEENDALVEDIVQNHPVRTICFREGNMSRDDYNDLLKSPQFWQDRRCERTLIFQTDTGILRNTIARFWDYNFVGAPWTWSELGDPFFQVGNGGLSLRDTAFSLNASIVHESSPNSLPEDVFFSYSSLYSQKSPTVDIASAFSVEYMYHPNPLGFHQAYRLNVYNETVQREFLKHWDGVSGHDDDFIRITDAWIENSRDGRMYQVPMLVQRLNVAVGPCGLALPKGTRMWPSFLDRNTIVTQPKRLVFQWKIGSHGKVLQTSCYLDPKLRVARDLYLSSKEYKDVAK